MQLEVVHLRTAEYTMRVTVCRVSVMLATKVTENIMPVSTDSLINGFEAKHPGQRCARTRKEEGVTRSTGSKRESNSLECGNIVTHNGTGERLENLRENDHAK